MEINKYISFASIKDLPPPPHFLRRSWNPSSLEDASLVDYNRKRCHNELVRLFQHVGELEQNQKQYDSCYCNIMHLKELTNFGYNQKKAIVKNVLVFVMNKNQTKINTQFI